MIVHHGQITTPRRLRARALAWAGPGLLWLWLFLALPMAAILALAFVERGTYPGSIEWRFTWDNLRFVLGFGSEGWTATNLLVLGRTALLAAITTALCILLSLPLAFAMARASPRWRLVWLALLFAPLCTNLVIRIVAWRIVLSSQWPFAKAAAALGLVDPGMPLYGNWAAMSLGMVNIFLPFAALPIYAVVERLDWSLVAAARDLYAGAWRTFRHGILPQILPGLLTAAVLTFIPAMGMFVVNAVLGPSVDLLGDKVYAGLGRDWPATAAFSLALIALTLAALVLLRRRLVVA